MQIGKILFPVTTLGPSKRLGIWTQGCNRFCNGCSNPELQIFDESKDVDVNSIYSAVKDFGFEAVTFSGGEPFLQVKDLRALIELFLAGGCDDILIYSGYTLEELAAKKDEDVDFILANISVLIDGPFDIAKVDKTPLRGSSNQRVWVFNSKYKDAYEEFLKQEKKVDIFYFDKDVHFIGIPFKGYDDLYKRFIKTRRK